MKLNMGIAGVGGIGFDKHLPEYAKLADSVELYAAADTDSQKLARAAAQYGIAHTFTDYQEMLRLPEVDFVVVALPNCFHGSVAMEAMALGKHVHCEKPLAVSYPEAQEMARTAARTKTVLMAGLNNRFLPQSRYVKQWIDQGFFGEIYHMNAFWKRRAGLPSSPWFVDRKLAGGGCLIDIGVHMLDLSLFLLGFPEPAYVCASSYAKFTGTPDRALFTYNETCLPESCPFDTEDLVSAQIRFCNGLSLSFSCSWASFAEKEEAGYEIYGTKAGAKYRKRPGQKPELTLFTLCNGKQTTLTPDFAPVVFDPLEFQHFIDCVQNPGMSCLAGAETCLLPMRLVDALYESADIGKPVFLQKEREGYS